MSPWCLPAYLSEFCVPLSSQAGHSKLRYEAARNLLIPPTRTVTIGGRGFSVAGPVAWNSIPMDLKDGTLTFPVFKKLLKTHLFNTIWTAALRFYGDCMKGAVQVPLSIQFNSTIKCITKQAFYETLWFYILTWVLHFEQLMETAGYISIKSIIMSAIGEHL